MSFFSETVYRQPFFPDSCRKAGKVAVARYDAKAVESFGIEKVHGVYDHCAVGGILPAGITKLLDRYDRMLEEHLLPASQIGACPVAIDSFYAGDAVFGHLGQKAFHDGALRIIGINEYRQFLLALFFNICLHELNLHMLISGRPSRSVVPSWCESRDRWSRR